MVYVGTVQGHRRAELDDILACLVGVPTDATLYCGRHTQRLGYTLERADEVLVLLRVSSGDSLSYRIEGGIKERSDDSLHTLSFSVQPYNVFIVERCRRNLIVSLIHNSSVEASVLESLYELVLIEEHPVDTLLRIYNTSYPAVSRVVVKVSNASRCFDNAIILLFVISPDDFRSLVDVVLNHLRKPKLYWDDILSVRLCDILICGEEEGWSHYLNLRHKDSTNTFLRLKPIEHLICAVIEGLLISILVSHYSHLRDRRGAHLFHHKPRLLCL